MLQIQNALTRTVKEQTVEKLEKAFQNSAVVYGMRFKNLSVSCGIMNFQSRRGLSSNPDTKSLLTTFRLSGETNDTVSANSASWSNNLRLQKHIATGSSREARLGDNNTSYQGAVLSHCACNGCVTMQQSRHFFALALDTADWLIALSIKSAVLRLLLASSLLC